MSHHHTDLTGHVAVITGASQGLGETIAKALAKEGMHLVLAARSKDKLDTLADSLYEEHPEIETLAVRCDVSDPDQVDNLMAQAIDTFGHIDVLINNAGVAAKISLLQEIPVAEINRVIDINLKGAIFAMRSALTHMVHRGKGTIVNINSVAGKTAFPYWSIYDASKFGLSAVTEAVREEQRGNGIRVFGIHPGAIDTPIWNTIELDHEPDHNGMLDAETIAETIVFALKQPGKVLFEDITVAPTQPAL